VICGKAAAIQYGASDGHIRSKVYGKKEGWVENASLPRRFRISFYFLLLIYQNHQFSVVFLVLRKEELSTTILTVLNRAV
jgi:hypothetical protein